MTDESLRNELDRRVEALGFEVVELERAGTRTRQVLRLRIDRLDSGPGHGVTVDDCARVSRELESYLDEEPSLGGRYVLEVSSPGVERPLVRRRDWERFAGKEVAISGESVLAGRGKRLEGELLGLSESGDREQVRLRLTDGEEVEIPREQITRAHLVFRWKDKS